MKDLTVFSNPHLTLQVKRSRSKGGLAGPDGTKSVFGQMCAKMSSFSPDSLLLPHRVWKVKFVGRCFAISAWYTLGLCLSDLSPIQYSTSQLDTYAASVDMI